MPKTQEKPKEVLSWSTALPRTQVTPPLPSMILLSFHIVNDENNDDLGRYYDKYYYLFLIRLLFLTLLHQNFTKNSIRKEVQLPQFKSPL